MPGPNWEPTFPCPARTVPREVLITKKDKPTGPVICPDPAVRSRSSPNQGINQLLPRKTSLDRRQLSMDMEQRYRLTCPDCGRRFWITPVD